MYQLQYSVRGQPVYPSKHLFDLEHALHILKTYASLQASRGNKVNYMDAGRTLVSRNKQKQEVFRATIVPVLEVLPELTDKVLA